MVVSLQTTDNKQVRKGCSSLEIECDVLVVGAGPAGLFSAITVLEVAPQTRVVVVDHAKKPGRKLLVAGGGQCNFTHAGSIKDFLNRYDAPPSSLRKILYGFNNEALRAWFAQQGVQSVEREDGKVFPRSLKSGDVLTALLHAFQSAGGKLLQNVEPTQVEVGDGNHGSTIFLKARSERGDIALKAHHMVVATGGRTYPKTGSDGTFFMLLSQLFEELNIVAKPYEPALSPLYIKGYPFGDLEGLSVEATIDLGEKTGKRGSASPKGLLFRKGSFSGPAAMEASIYAQVNNEVRFNFAPHIAGSHDVSFLAEELFTQSRMTHKEAATLFQSFFDLPKRLAESLFSIGEIKQAKAYKHYARDLSKRECKTMAQSVVDARFIVERLGSDGEAMVSRGGVCLEEINLATMQLKKLPAIRMAGECIDVTGDTGGYNLQWAFSSARRAGLALGEQLARSH